MCSDGPVEGGEVESGILLVRGLEGSDQKGGIRAAPLPCSARECNEEFTQSARVSQTGPTYL